MLFKKRKRKKYESPDDFDFFPLFFWDKGLSEAAKIVMCIVCGGKPYREKTLNKLKAHAPAEVVDAMQKAIKELEFYGYITNEPYLGDYREPRLDKRFCVCPNNRLPKIIPPTPGAMPSLRRKASEMYEDAARLGFIAETGKDTTHFLYSALRMFTGIENILEPDELAILPHVGTEPFRQGTKTEFIAAYPHAIATIVITTERVIFIQEDGDPNGRKEGLARIIARPFSSIESVSIDERTGRVSFAFRALDDDPTLTKVSIDLMTITAVDNYRRYYSITRAILHPSNTLPQLTHERETHITE